MQKATRWDIRRDLHVRLIPGSDETVEDTLRITQGSDDGGDWVSVGACSDELEGLIQALIRARTEAGGALPDLDGLGYIFTSP